MPQKRPGAVGFETNLKICTGHAIRAPVDHYMFHDRTKSDHESRKLHASKVAREGRREDKRLTMVDQEGRQVTEIVGL